MSFGIVVRVGREAEPVDLHVDEQADLVIRADTHEANISLRGFAESLKDAGILPSPTAQDLLLLATAVFAADTRIRREEGDDGWTRQIALSIPVRDTSVWEAAKPSLQRALRFLTGDLWNLSFRPSALALGFADTADDDKTPRGARVALFSGGLDSFIGALDSVATGESLVLVGHYTDGSASKPQDYAFGHVSKYRRAQQHLSLLRAWIVAPNDLFGHGNDDRQRSRSVLFIALGVLVAEALRRPELIIPENGLISLNVPLTDLRIGSYSTRTTHPHFLRLLGEALVVLRINVGLRNPYQFKTKGEMLAECSVQDGLIESAADTMSCAHPTASRWTHKGAPSVQHCGRCTACLIRRAAFLRGLGDDRTPYTEQDLQGAELRSNGAKGRDIRAVRLAASRILEQPQIAELLVLKPGPLSGQYHEYADLYRRGMRELWALVEGTLTRGAY